MGSAWWKRSTITLHAELASQPLSIRYGNLPPMSSAIQIGDHLILHATLSMM